MTDKGFQLNWISKYRDELYGIAILTVLFFHFAMLHSNAYEGSDQWTYKLTKAFYDYFGSGGVDLFVFMSGMGLYYSFSKNSDVGRFYGRRFRRILIPYLIVGGIFWGRVDLFYRAEGITRFLKDFFYVTFVTEGVNNLWFISFIGVMYLIFPLIYKASFNNRYGRILYLLILIAALLIPYYLQIHHHDLYKNLDKALVRIPVFVIGIMAGKAIKEKKTIPHLVAILIAILGLYCGYYTVINGVKGVPKRYSTTLLALGVLIICVYILRLIDKAIIIREILRFFGKYSLELYLLHILMWELMGEAGIPLHRASRYALLVVASCILAPLLSRITTLISKLITNGCKEEKAA